MDDRKKVVSFGSHILLSQPVSRVQEDGLGSARALSLRYCWRLAGIEYVDYSLALHGMPEFSKKKDLGMPNGRLAVTGQLATRSVAP